MKKHNYLNNRDILKEIHKSKKTYCSFLTPDDGDYDIIVTSIAKINKKNTADGRKLRAERLGRAAYDVAQEASDVKLKLDDFAVNVRDIAATDVVFRVMTYDHIPMEEPVSKKKKKLFIDEFEETEEDEDDGMDDDSPKKFAKLNFPPFQHYKVDEEGNPYLVGKSHWKGDLETGEFSKEHGDLTNKLAHMFLKICERYASRSNWRGYTYNDEMRGQALLQLAQIGLKFDESKSQNPFAYYTAAITNSFTRVLNMEKRNQNLRDDILEMNNLTPSYTRQGLNSWTGSGGGSSGTYDESGGE